MSGWIKFDKALESDPRVLKIARHLGVTHERYGRNAGVTVVIGGLVRLWSYADTHIDEDDILAVSVDDIDEIVGITGFAEALPPDWLQIVDGESVQLPDFHDHNGSLARRRAQAASRQRKHRDGVAKERNAGVTQQRDGKRYQTKTKTKTKRSPQPPAEFPPDLDRAAFDRFVEFRQKIGKTVKPVSLLALATKLAKFGADQGAVVDQSIAFGWQGFFPLKDRPQIAAVPDGGSARVVTEEDRARSDRIALERSARGYGIDPTDLTESQINDAIWRKRNPGAAA